MKTPESEIMTTAKRKVPYLEIAAELRGKIRGVLLRGDDEAVVRGQGYALPLPDPVLPD